MVKRTKRAKNNTGAVRQLPSGNWTAQVMLPDGKRISHTENKLKDLQAWVRKTTDQAARGLTYDSSRTTYADFLADWLELKRGELRSKTIEQYTRLIDLYIRPRLGKLKLKDLTPARVQTFYSQLQRDGTGSRTIEINHAIVSGSCKHALRLGLLPVNPAAAALVPKPERRQMQVWTESEVSRFLVAARGHRNEVLYYLALATGMRRGELLGLQWSDIDWRNGIIRVQRQAQAPEGGGYVFAEPKTVQGVRPIQVGPGVLQRLREQLVKVDDLRRAAGKRWRDNDMVFPSAVGTPQFPDRVGWEFHKITVPAGIRRIRFHDLRHTAASLMLAHRVPPVTVAGILGHSLDILVKYYAHFIPGDQGDAPALMDALTQVHAVELAIT